MSTTELPPIPAKQEVDASIKLITDNAQRIFCWNYDRSRDQLVTLYNKAMASQWNSVTELDWSIDVDPEQVVRESPQSNVLVELARAAAEVDGSPLKSWGEKEFLQLGIESIKAQLSQFMHGEQGAMMVAAKIVETVPWIDARVLRVDADDGRGPPHRGVRQVPAHEARPGVPDEPVPRGADRRPHHR